MGINKFNRIKFVFVVAYVIIILYITIYVRDRSLNRAIRLDFLLSYKQWLLDGNANKGRLILLNIALFIPFGFLVYGLVDQKFHKKRFTFCLLSFIGAILSLLIETVQYFSGRGIFDFDDLVSNIIGTVTGIVLHRLVGNLCKDKQLLIYIFSSIAVLSGIVGCCIITKSVKKSVSFIDQFYFDVYSVTVDNGLEFSGYCKAWYTKTPLYELSFLTEDGEDYPVKVSITDDTFTASIDEEPSQKGEVLIKFQGYKTLHTSVFINGTDVEYIPGHPSAPAGIDMSGAVLKSYSDLYDTYVYQQGEKLIWLIGFDINKNTSIIYQLRTNEPAKLPEIRKKYGFDNRGFKAESSKEKERIGDYKVYEDIIPNEYHVTSIVVGFYEDDTIIWKESFRVQRPG